MMVTKADGSAGRVLPEARPADRRAGLDILLIVFIIIIVSIIIIVILINVSTSKSS